MPPADFILLASLRDNENSFFDYEPDEKNAGGLSEGMAGFSPPKDVVKLMKELVGFKEVEDKTSVVFSACSTSTVKAYIAQIQKALESGSSIAMLINDYMIKDIAKPSFIIPTHWIGIIDIGIDDVYVKVKYFSWGYKPNTHPISISRFTDCCFGYVEGNL